jgi:GntR family transcriptional repressor for pyruvate dehydrogenase complex
MLQPIESSSIIDQVSDQMKNLIFGGTLQPGDLFPSESELANYMRVSRTVIRESKKSLIGMGLLETHGKRTYVRGNIFDAAANLFSLGFEHEPGSIMELMEVREVIETSTAAFAALRADDEMLQRLGNLLELQRAAITNHDIKSFGESDIQWHTAIIVASQNRLLAKIVVTIRKLLEEIIAIVLEVPQSDQDAFLDHEEITAAIVRRDPEGARQAMYKHLRRVKDILNKVVENKKLETNG